MRSILYFLAFILIANNTKAQKGSNLISMGIETGIPVWRDDAGIGGSIKGLYGIGETGQITLSLHYYKLHTTAGSFDFGTQKTKLLPVLIGYRKNFNQFYLEPQIGYGLFEVNRTEGSNHRTSSRNAMFYAINSGWRFKVFDIGLRYQKVHKSGGNIYNGDFPYYHFDYLGVYAAYSLKFKGNNK
jgi:hypothetical protein